MPPLRHILAAAALTAAAGALPALAQDGDPPVRVVSMNLCTDQLAMLVAAPGQLVSVSYLASDPRASAMAAQARALLVNHGFAEEIAFLRPDLVLAGRYTTRVTVDMLERLGHPVAIFEPENSIDDIRRNLRQMGEVLHREARAEELIRLMDTDLAQIAANPPKGNVRAAFYYTGGFTSGSSSLANDIASAAGVANIAPDLGLDAGGILPLEALILAGPDLIIRGQSYAGHSRAGEMLSHPALMQLIASRSGHETSPDYTCGTPMVTAAIRALSRAAQEGATP